MHIQFQLAQQCIQTSTRINSSSVHTYIFRLFYFACNSTRVCDPKCNKTYLSNAIQELSASADTMVVNKSEIKTRSIPFNAADSSLIEMHHAVIGCLE